MEQRLKTFETKRQDREREKRILNKILRKPRWDRIRWGYDELCHIWTGLDIMDNGKTTRIEYGKITQTDLDEHMLSMDYKTGVKTMRRVTGNFG